MNCKYCGIKIFDDAIYCSKCGKRLVGTNIDQLQFFKDSEKGETEFTPTITIFCFLSWVPLTFKNGKWGEVFMRDDIGKEINIEKLCPYISFITNKLWVNFSIGLLDYDKNHDKDLINKYGKINKIEVLKNRILNNKKNAYEVINLDENEIKRIAIENDLDANEIKELKGAIEEAQNKAWDEYLDDIDDEGNYKPKNVLKIAEEGILFKKSYSFMDKITGTKSVIACKFQPHIFNYKAISFGELLKDFINRKVKIVFSYVEDANS